MRTVFYNKLEAAAHADLEPELREVTINSNDVYVSELIHMANLGYRAIIGGGQLIGMEVHGND